MPTKKKRSTKRRNLSSSEKDQRAYMRDYYKWLQKSEGVEFVKKKDMPYTFVERETQTIRKKTYAPLGRPPTESAALRKYNQAKKKPTQYAKKKARRGRR